MRALRSIGGRVLILDPATEKEAPIGGKTVLLKEAGKSSMGDAAGQSLFQELAPGTLFGRSLRTLSG